MNGSRHIRIVIPIIPSKINQKTVSCLNPCLPGQVMGHRRICSYSHNAAGQLQSSFGHFKGQLPHKFCFRFSNPPISAGHRLFQSLRSQTARCHHTVHFFSIFIDPKIIHKAVSQKQLCFLKPFHQRNQKHSRHGFIYSCRGKIYPSSFQFLTQHLYSVFSI